MKTAIRWILLFLAGCCAFLALRLALAYFLPELSALLFDTFADEAGVFYVIPESKVFDFILGLLCGTAVTGWFFLSRR